MDKIRGCLSGLAVCDAVGTTLEFSKAGSFEPLSDMIGGGPFSLLPGQWTDDTSMALCIAESLIECQGYNPQDQMKRYHGWYSSGHLSSNGECFDIGMTTSSAIFRFSSRGFSNPYQGSTSDNAAGNGCLMRLCPVPLAFHKHPVAAMELSADSARTTHGATAAKDACRYFAALLVGCLEGASKEELLSTRYSPVKGYWEQNPLCEAVDEVACGSYKERNPPEIIASGYVVKTLEAALWAFYNTDNFRDGCLKAVNLGMDTDTVGAIYGQIAGCYYGYESIPLDWREKCFLSSLIGWMSEEIHDLASTISTPSLHDMDNTNWDQQSPPLSKDKLSAKYSSLKLDGYGMLEDENGQVVRKTNPCPKQYKSLEELESDIERIKSNYRGLPLECQDDKLLKDFERMWCHAKEKVSKRISRKFV